MSKALAVSKITPNQAEIVDFLAAKAAEVEKHTNAMHSIERDVSMLARDFALKIEQVRPLLPHGDWQIWYEAQGFHTSLQSAQRALARLDMERALESKTSRVTFLELSAAAQSVLTKKPARENLEIVAIALSEGKIKNTDDAKAFVKTLTKTPPPAPPGKMLKPEPAPEPPAPFQGKRVLPVRELSASAKMQLKLLVQSHGKAAVEAALQEIL